MLVRLLPDFLCNQTGKRLQKRHQSSTSRAGVFINHGLDFSPSKYFEPVEIANFVVDF